MTAAVNDVDLAFSAALEKDADVSAAAEIAAPPRKPAVVDPDAPHGRADDGTPHAPYGIAKGTGKPRIKPAGPGRPVGDEKPRVARAVPAPAAGKQAATPDYTGDLDDLADGFWMLLSGFPAPGSLKTRLNAQAALLAAHKPHLVKAANIAAQNHDGTAQLIEKLTSGNAAWVLPCMFAAGPFVAQSVAMWRSKAGDVAELAEENAKNFKAVVGAAMLQAAAGEAQAAA